MSEEQDAARIQTFVQYLDGGLPCSGVEIDEHVATEYCIGATESAKPVLIEEVHLAELTQLSNALDDAPAIRRLLKEGLTDLRWRRAKARRAIDPSTRRRDAAARNVRPVNAHIPKRVRLGRWRGRVRPGRARHRTAWKEETRLMQ